MRRQGAQRAELAADQRQLGFSATQTGALMLPWALGPRITWPAFDLGSVRAKLPVPVQSDEEETLANELEQMPDDIDENLRLVSFLG